MSAQILSMSAWWTVVSSLATRSHASMPNRNDHWSQGRCMYAVAHHASARPRNLTFFSAFDLFSFTDADQAHTAPLNIVEHYAGRCA